MANRKISAIIPVYGVEQFIERCARSLFEQTLENIEYIFIDDCSPDESISILSRLVEEYLPRFDREGKSVRIERIPKNSGLPAARKHGIQFCKGEYVIHCDSDDWVEPDMFQKMYDKAKMTNADMTLCGYKETDGMHVFNDYVPKEENKHTLISNLLMLKEPWNVWNKLCRRSLYDNELVYPTYSMGEDMVLTMQLILKCRCICVVPEILYNYFYNISSISKAQSETSRYKNWIESALNAETVVSIFKAQNLDKDYTDELVYLRFLQKRLAGILARRRKYSREWLRMFDEINMKVFCLPNVSFRDKLKFGITLVNAEIQRLL